MLFVRRTELFGSPRFEVKNLTEGIPVELRFVKFQSVQSLSVRGRVA